MPKIRAGSGLQPGFNIEPHRARADRRAARSAAALVGTLLIAISVTAVAWQLDGQPTALLASLFHSGVQG